MRATIISVLLILASCGGGPGQLVYAQDARVIPLSGPDAAEVKVKYEAMKKAEADFEALKDRIEKDYTVVLEDDKDRGNTNVEALFSSSPFLTTATSCASSLTLTINGSQRQDDRCKKERAEAEKNRKPDHYLRSGWENGFTFDASFKFIVPKAVVDTSRVCGGGSGTTFVYCMPTTNVMGSPIGVTGTTLQGTLQGSAW